MGPRRVQPCITVENWLRNNFCTWEQTYRHTDTQTDRHTDIHKGNNNEIKYAKDITAVKNNTLWVHLDVIRCFCTILEK